MKYNLKIFIIMFIIFLISLSFAAETIPVTASQTDILDLVKIGKMIEGLLTLPLKNIENKLALISRPTATIAENIFISLFILDTANTIANQYLEDSIEKIPTTFVVRAFFGSCVLALIHNGLIFGIMSDVMKALVKGVNNAPDYNWFADGQEHTVLSHLVSGTVNGSGPLGQMDTLFNSLLMKVDILHVDSLPQIFLIGAIIVLMVRLYIQAFKIVCGMLIKGLEWCIGLPVALIFLGLKGSKVTEEYFDIGIRYIYRTALDFTITMLCISIGAKILTEEISPTSLNGTGSSLIAVLDITIAFSIWKTLLFGAETLISGISSGSPAFTAAHAAGIVSNFASAKGGIGKMAASLPMAVAGGIINKAKGGTFSGGALKSLGNDVKNVGVKLASSEAWKNTDTGMTQVQKMGEDGKMKTVWATGDAHSTEGLHHVMSDAKTIADSKKAAIERIKQVDKFEKKHGITEDMMKKMGHHTQHQRDVFMNKHAKIFENKNDLDDFGIKTTELNKKGKVIDKSLFDIQREIAQNKVDATKINSNAQKSKSANSQLTKQMEKSLQHMDNNSDKTALLKTWLKSSQDDPINFSEEKFSKNLNNIISNINNSNLPPAQKQVEIQQVKDMLKSVQADPSSKSLKFESTFEKITVDNEESPSANGINSYDYEISDSEMSQIANKNQIEYNNFLNSAINSCK